jgi:hypothetical protein
VCESTIEVTHVRLTDRGQLMDDDLGLRPADRLGDLIAVECVRHHRHRAQLVQHALLRLAARHAMNLMARRNQTRHELLPDRSGRSCHEHSHHQLRPSGTPCFTYRRRGGPGCDTSAHQRAAGA